MIAEGAEIEDRGQDDRFGLEACARRRRGCLRSRRSPRGGSRSGVTASRPMSASSTAARARAFGFGLSQFAQAGADLLEGPYFARQRVLGKPAGGKSNLFGWPRPFQLGAEVRVMPPRGRPGWPRGSCRRSWPRLPRCRWAPATREHPYQRDQLSADDASACSRIALLIVPCRRASPRQFPVPPSLGSADA